MYETSLDLTQERDDKYDLNQLTTEPWTPNQGDSLAIKMLWFMLSKVAEMSIKHDIILL